MLRARFRLPVVALGSLAVVLACGGGSGSSEGAATDQDPNSAQGPSDQGGSDQGSGDTSSSGGPNPTQDAASSDDGGGDASTAPDADSAALVAARPYTFRVPAGYDPAKPTPLVVALHGYADSGAKIDSYFQLGTLVDTEGFLYATPDGTLDLAGNRFWNATDACCNLTFRPVDDVAYLNALLDDVESKYNVDRKRVYFVGHSNGAFMSHRMACDASPRIAAIVSLAGAVWFDGSKCVTTSPVSVLQVHGDDDQTIHYEGGFAASLYPSAHQTVATWAQKNGCTGTLDPTGVFVDIDTAIAGNETRQERYSGCPTAPVGVELWTVAGGPHIPPLAQPGWPQMVYGFLKAHPKP